jgi:hypothetical protein
MIAGVPVGGIGEVVPLVAGIVAILGGAAKLIQYLAKRGRRDESRRRELGEECAVVLVRLKSSIDEAWWGVLQWGQGWADQEHLRQIHEGLLAESLALIEQLARVKVVFGPKSRAAGAFGDATDAVKAFYIALEQTRLEHEEWPGKEDAAGQIQAVFEDNGFTLPAIAFAKAQARFESAVR